MSAATQARKVLIIVTSHGEMGASGKATGVWLEELAVPYLALKRAGVEPEVASVRGGRLPIDPTSVKPTGENPPEIEEFLRIAAREGLLSASRPLSEVDLDRFDAVFFPGGHGTMWDFPSDPRVGQLVAAYLSENKPVAAVCHGPAALVGARFANGTPVVQGRDISGFTNSEERAAGLTEVVPFALETKLEELGARIKKGPDFKPFAVRDGLLVTGQNPASSARVVELLIEVLQERGA